MDLLNNGLVSVQWLADNKSNADVKILDGTWCMASEAMPLEGQFIPDAQFFDIDEIADLTSPMKHMLPSIDVFAETMSNMGIENKDYIIVYDRHGFRAAARLWWTFRSFQHQAVSILNGGLPAWIKAGQKISSSPLKTTTKTHYKAPSSISNVISMEELVTLLPHKPQIIDARSKGRFNGTEAEPRPGLRSGHIPGSLSLPFGNIRTAGGELKDILSLASIVGKAGVDLDKPIITTCGSGITAAALAFVFYRLGAKEVSVYDGSWTEWGASDAPIEI